MKQPITQGKMPSANDAKKALTPKERIFGFKIHNIPTINLRHQYATDRATVFDPELPTKIHGWRFQLLDQPVTMTCGDPDVFFSNLIRTTAFGVESVIRAAVWEELAFTNWMTETILQAMREDRARSMVETYYNRLPAYVSSSARLKEYNEELWSTVKVFYAEIRNPLSHGNQFADVKQTSLQAAFEMFDKVYSWIDSWSDPNRIMRILASTTFQVLK
jgi:hypothetical protein